MTQTRSCSISILREIPVAPDSLAHAGATVQLRHMNSTRLTPLILAALFAAAQYSEAARAPELRYRLPVGQTNLYSVQIELRGENGTEMLAGNLSLAARSTGSNVLGLSIRGTLMPKRDSTSMRPPMMYGSGGNYPRWMTPISLNEGADIQFDESGLVLRLAGDYPLPIPLGTLAQSFVEPLPVKAEARWEIIDNLGVLDEPLSLGPAASFLPAQSFGMPYYGSPLSSRGNAPALVPVTRKIRYEIKSTTAGQVTIAKRLNLDSHLQFGSEPRINATGEGEFVLDQESGLLRRTELQCKTVSNTDAVTRRSTVTLRIELLEGAERETALQSQAASLTARPAKKLSGEDIQKILTDLKSDDAGTRGGAALKLQTSELSETPPALLDLMTGFLNDPDISLSSAAIKVVADYGTQEHVPVLLQLLKDSEHFSRNNIIRGLGRLKDKRAAEPLAALLASGGSDAYQAGEALAKIGPDAEDAVLAVLKEKHVETRRQVCRVLKQIGTKKSLEPLRELMLSTDRMLGESAGEAVRAIMARG